MILSRILSILLIGCLLFSVSLFVRKYRELPKAIRYFGWFIVVSFITETGSFSLARIEIPNLFFLHFYTPLKVMFIGLFFSPIFKSDTKDYRPYLFVVILMIVLFSILNTLYLQPLETINSYAYTLGNLFVIVCGAVSFFRLTNQKGLKDEYSVFMSTVLPAMFVYECTSLFIFMFGPYLQEMEISDQRHLWIANGFLSLVFQIYVVLGFLKKYPKSVNKALN